MGFTYDAEYITNSGFLFVSAGELWLCQRVWQCQKVNGFVANTSVPHFKASLINVMIQNETPFLSGGGLAKTEIELIDSLKDQL